MAKLDPRSGSCSSRQRLTCEGIDRIFYTPQDIRAEHDAAVASLSPAQRQAFARLTEFESCLEARFVVEAEARSFRPANDDCEG
jgi:hypothetical protein